MEGKSVYKAGKLIKVSLEYNEKSMLIDNIKIEGDFFLYPEEGLQKIEYLLKGTKLEKTELARKIEAILNNEKIEAHGFNCEQLSEAIIQACSKNA